LRRAPLTTTHPHGYVLARSDRKLGLVRISKNASTESKARLRCVDWVAFGQFAGPSVAFVREPFARFISSLPETILRMTQMQIAEPDRQDRVIIPEDIHTELLAVAKAPIDVIARTFLEAVEYAFFDAHHEPQVNFLCDRQMRLRIDPRLYPTESFEQSLNQIENWLKIDTAPAGQKSNKGGAKPLKGRNGAIDLVRLLTRSGVYRRVGHSGLLGLRYGSEDGPITLRELNGFANRFTTELKAAELGADFRRRVLKLYETDEELWNAVRERDGDVHASAVWPA